MRASPSALRAGALVITILAFVAALAIEPDETSAPPPATTAETRADDAATPTGRAADPRPNILLLTIDTQRADHSSLYGYAHETTPTLARLAEHGTRFDHAYAASTWTVPSVVSILTGVLPSEHGVMHGMRIGFEANASDVIGQEILSADLHTLPADLHAAGYRTVGVTANIHLGETFGFARGFDSYTCLDFFSNTDRVGAVVAEHLDALREGETPYFLWVHLVDPHAAYHPRQPYFDEWWPADRPRYPQIDDFFLEEFIDRLFATDHIPPADGLAYATMAYDTEIRAADDYLGTLLAALDDGHLAVVVTSDHGEELGDHLQVGHGHTAFEEVAHVPLVVAVPGSAAQVVDTNVSLVDVLPTLRELAGIAPASELPGRSLLPTTRGEPLEARDVFIETGRGDEVVRAIVRGRIKYGRRVTPAPVEGLFDLDADPHELQNLVAARPELAAELRARLEETVAEAAARRPATTTLPIEVPADVREQLRALGYGN